MSQHDYVLDNQSGASFRADLNSVLSAVVSQNSGATEPATMYAFMPWADTTSGLLKIRNATNNAWVTVGTLAEAYLGLASKSVSSIWTAVQKSTVAASSASLSVNISTVMDSIIQPTSGGALTYSGIAAGIGFEHLFLNTANYAITNDGNIKCPASLFARLSATGRYRLTGKCFDGVNVDLDISEAHV